MAAINKFVGHSTLLLALCWLLRQAIAEHLCQSILSGTPFSSLDIKSVTYVDDKTLAIFVGAESVYLVPTRNTSAMGMNLGAVQPVNLSKSPFAASLKQIPEDETPQAIYCTQPRISKGTAMGRDWPWNWKLKIEMTLILTKQAIYTVDVRKEKLLASNREPHEEFTIAHSQTSLGDVFGYKFNRDLYAKSTNFIVISQLQWSTNGTVTPPNEFEPFYYLQMTDKPDEVVFVPRGDLKDFSSSHQLLDALPSGSFLFDSMLYLLDDQLGCVHVIRPWTSPKTKHLVTLNSTAAKRETFVFRRISWPYEDFFCATAQVDRSHFPYDAERCETTIGFKSLKKRQKVASLYSGQSTDKSEASTFNWTTLSIGLLVVVLLLGLGAYFYCAYYLNDAADDSVASKSRNFGHHKRKTRKSMKKRRSKSPARTKTPKPSKRELYSSVSS